jgi:glycerophosphoryl diester phosphodiesterase
MKRTRVLILLTLAILTSLVRPVGAHRHHHRGTIEDLLELDVKPFAIAHRGFGDNLSLDDLGPVDPTRPIENTVAAVRKGFRAGASVVEIDVQLTRDGHVAVFHDDFLADKTCLNQLTLAELQDRLPFVPSLEDVLDEAREFNDHAGWLTGLVIVELKAAAPLCDPHDTQDRAIVRAVSRVVRHTGMTRQVMFTSFSPVLLLLASEHAPEITRDLEISGVQFLTPPEVEAFLGYPVTLIQKHPDLGLQWAEVGPIYRLPGYRSVDEVIATAQLVRARVIEADLLFLQSAGAPFVGAVHAFGLKALGYTAMTPAEWFFLQSLELDGIYVSDVPFGVAHEAPIP